MKKKKTIWERITLGSGGALFAYGLVSLIWWAVSDFGRSGWWASHDTTGHLVLYIVVTLIGAILVSIGLTMYFIQKKANKL